jgi:hypothetical protein
MSRLTDIVYILSSIKFLIVSMQNGKTYLKASVLTNNKLHLGQ